MDDEIAAFLGGDFDNEDQQSLSQVGLLDNLPDTFAPMKRHDSWDSFLRNFRSADKYNQRIEDFFEWKPVGIPVTVLGAQLARWLQMRIRGVP